MNPADCACRFSGGWRNLKSHSSESTGTIFARRFGKRYGRSRSTLMNSPCLYSLVLRSTYATPDSTSCVPAGRVPSCLFRGASLIMKQNNKVTLVCEGPVDPFSNVALVDAERLQELSAFNWRVLHGRHGRYAVRYERVNGRSRKVSLHSAVFGEVPDGFEIDHRNRNTMDNRQENLRAATTQQNQANRGPQRNNTSELKGVSWKQEKWHAQIEVNGRSIHLGCFDDKIAAGRVVDDEAKFRFGEFAWLNFPNDSTVPQ